MAGGTTIEVVAVSNHPSDAKTWWRPAGMPFDKPFVNPLPAHCSVEIKLAAGPWKTEASDPEHGGHSMVSDGHKYYFGKARSYEGGTSIAIAHNIVGRDNRIVAVDLQGKEHAGNYSSGGGGEILGLLDAAFGLPPDQIREFRVQSRPFERAEIKNICLEPRSAGRSTTTPNTEMPQRETGQLAEPSSGGPDADTDGDGLSDFQEIHKYRTDPKKLSTAGDGISDGDRQRRREFTYTIRSVVKVMPPVNIECLNDDYQDARVLSRGDNYVELEVIHFPLNTNAESIRGNSSWRCQDVGMEEYLRPGITTNWDAAMQGDLVSALKSAGINPDRLDDRELVIQVSHWLFANSKFVNMFCTHYISFPQGRATIYPGLETKFESDKGDHAWTTREQLEHELFGRSMFANRTHGSCTSSAVYLTTVLRALGIPTRMILAIPLVDGNDPAQLTMVRDGISHHGVRRTLLLGLASASGYANHTFNEVFVGGRWIRLNYQKLGQNSLDANNMGLLTHVNTFNDLSETPLAATWGKRYAKGERDATFRYGNPYRCEEVTDHFGKYARLENPELKEHRAITISRAYWANAADAPADVKSAKWLFRNDGAGRLFIHGDEWFDDQPWQQHKAFYQAAGKEFLFKADGHPDVRGRITMASIIGPTQSGIREMEILIPTAEYAKMTAGIEYTLTPRNEVAGYEWKTKGRVTITK